MRPVDNDLWWAASSPRAGPKAASAHLPPARRGLGGGARRVAAPRTRFRSRTRHRRRDGSSRFAGRTRSGTMTGMVDALADTDSAARPTRSPNRPARRPASGAGRAHGRSARPSRPGCCCWSRSRRTTSGSSRPSGSRCWRSRRTGAGFWAGAGLGVLTGLSLLIPLLSWAGGYVGPVWFFLPVGEAALLRALAASSAPWPPRWCSAGGGAGRWSPARSGCCRRPCATGPRSAASRGGGWRSARATRRCCGWPRWVARRW